MKWNAAEYAANSSVQQGWARELIAKLKLRGDEHILDVGCGDGKVTATGKARSFWHNNPGQRGWNMAYGDGHVALFFFPKNYSAANVNDPVNIDGAWW